MREQTRFVSLYTLTTTARSVCTICTNSSAMIHKFTCMGDTGLQTRSLVKVAPNQNQQARAEATVTTKQRRAHASRETHREGKLTIYHKATSSSTLDGHHVFENMTVEHPIFNKVQRKARE